MTLSNKNHYELLGVPRNAPPQVIKDSYKELARIYHPDSHYFDDILADAGMSTATRGAPALSAEAEETFKIITEAYNTLNNAARRAEYDAMLPGEQPDWEGNVRADFEADQRQRQFESPDVAQPYSWGSFGSPPPGDVPGSRFGSPVAGNEGESPSQEDLAYRSVSEMIRQQNSLTAKLKRLFGL